MRVLLDTHIALWSVTADEKLSPAARRLIENMDNGLAVSVAVLWEIAIKHAAQRPGAKRMPISARQAAGHFEDAGFDILLATNAHILAIEELPPIHADPFDRLMIAQAQVDGMTLLTSDAVIAKYPGAVRKV